MQLLMALLGKDKDTNVSQLGFSKTGNNFQDITKKLLKV